LWDKRHGRKRRERGGWTVTFLNVARMYNKDRDFWDKLREWDVMVLLETWVERRG